MSSQIFVARWVFPISSTPIHGGWVQIADDRIVAFGSGAPPTAGEDLGDVAILPGLVNAHTHLEFSDCQEPIGRQGMELADWIGDVVKARGNSSADQKQHAVAMGLEESSAAGVSLLGEITSPPCVYPANVEGPQVYSFAEVLGLKAERSNERLIASIAHRDNNGPMTGWSPHAPYSTSLATVQECVRLSREHKCCVAMHVAESPAERELLCAATGPFRSALESFGAWEEGLFPWPTEPVTKLIQALSRSHRALLVHGNDLTDQEIAEIARHRNLSVVYCPRTHAFFGHTQHPVDRLIDAGVNVAIGTDSRASNPDLNLWGEVQYLLKHRTDLDPNDVLSMATINGSEAMGLPTLGRIEIGASSRLAMVPTTAQTLSQVYADFSTSESRLIQRS